MAIFKKPVPAVIQKAAVKPQLGKPAIKPAEGFQVVSIDSIEFLTSGRGGGKQIGRAHV